MKVCPFCGAGETRFDENQIWNGGLKPSTLVSVALRHWCEKAPGCLRQYIEIRAKTQADAETIWNKRTA